MRTIPNTVFTVAGGFVTGDGWIDSEVNMGANTAIYLSSTNNLTMTSVNMLDNALLFIVLFDSSDHGVSFKSDSTTITSMMLL
jgi:hypothetical protein